MIVGAPGLPTARVVAQEFVARVIPAPVQTGGPVAVPILAAPLASPALSASAGVTNVPAVGLSAVPAPLATAAAPAAAPAAAGAVPDAIDASATPATDSPAATAVPASASPVAAPKEQSAPKADRQLRSAVSGAPTGRAFDGDTGLRDGAPIRPEAFQPLGGRAVGDDATLVFGGSFSPPTLEHMGIFSHLMYRFGFTKAKLMVATPYKKGAPPAEVSLDVSRVAVENLHEILGINSIPYKGFRADGAGKSSWTGRGGRRFSAEVDDSDVRAKTTETIETLERLKAQNHGDPRKTYWVSGGDSFASVPTWTPRWREMVESANWLIISRPGFDSGEKSVNFKRSDPLRPVLGDEFIDRYAYRYDEARKIHVYEHKDPGKPGLYVIDQPVLDDSSTKNRASLAAPGDHEHAQAGLQPSVFMRSLERGYYADPKLPEQGGYEAYTRKNLEIYLSQLFKRLDNPDGEAVAPGEIAQFRRLSREFTALVKKEVAESKDVPLYRRAAAEVAEHVAEHLELIKDLKQLRKKIRELDKQFGGRQFAVLYLAGELAEMFVIPPVAFMIGGKAGLAVAPFIHPNEMFVIPSYIGYQILKRRAKRKKLAGGDYSFYRELTSYSNKLLRGDPDSIVARVPLSGSVALEGDLELNVVKSRWPKWLPLWLRRWDDRRVTWHDMNVSTNELRAMLGDKPLADEFKESSGRDAGLLGYRLLDAVVGDPAARLRFDLFAGWRYFERIAMGQVPDELLGGFKPAERQAILALRAQSGEYKKALADDELKSLRQLTADYYALARAARAEPARVRTDSFWTTVIDQMMTRYPGETFAWGKGAAMKDLARRLSVLLPALAEGQPELFSGAKVTYRGKDVALFDRGYRVLDPSLRAEVERLTRPQPSDADAVRYKKIAVAARHYFTVNARLFAGREGATELAGVLPTTSRGGDLSGGNLIWEMQLLNTHARRQFDLLEGGFYRGLLFLEQREKAPRADKVFWDALDRIEGDLAALRERMRELEYQWLKAKYPHQVGAASVDERLVPGYDQTVARYAELRAQTEDKLERLRRLNHMMMGTEAADVVDVDALRAQVGAAIGVPRESNELGLSFFRRTTGRVRRIVGRLAD